VAGTTYASNQITDEKSWKIRKLVVHKSLSNVVLTSTSPRNPMGLPYPAIDPDVLCTRVAMVSLIHNSEYNHVNI
jgi:hypothetical protein